MEAPSDLARSLMPLVRDTARKAGSIAMGFFRSGLQTSARIWSKSGGSPVTEADVSVDTFLKVRLSAALPEAGWLSEETADDPSRLDRRLVWIVDPIDGTRAFLSGSHDWSIAIALLADGRPELAIVHAPAHETLYEARRGHGAKRNDHAIAVSRAERLKDVSVAGPKFLIDHLERRIEGLKRVPRIPSLALRVARVAEGSIDAGVISSDARDWDIAAADLILQEAGGILSATNGSHPRYNEPEPVHGELVAVPRRLHGSMMDAMKARDRTGAEYF